MTPTIEKQSGRLASLDILRGFDMFLLVFLQPVLVAVGQAADVPWLNAVLYQLDHEAWDGFRFWDIVMPLFMFMCGVSMPFSFARYGADKPKWPLMAKIVKRVVLLWLLGMLVQGNLLAFDPEAVRLYSNTLQAIAAGYLIGAVMVLNLPLRWQIAATVALLIIYWLPMTFCGDWTPQGNFAEKVDRLVLGRWRDGVYRDNVGQWHFSISYTYTWVWSSLTFAVTVMTGYFAGLIIKRRGRSLLTVKTLIVVGVALIAAALIWSLQMPVVKRLWTSSMTLLSSGLCFLLMAFFFWLIDIKGRRRGLEWLKIYGMNSITAYLLGEVINFRSIPASITYGLQPIVGSAWYDAWLTTANFTILFFILLFMYKRRLFIKF